MREKTFNKKKLLMELIDIYNKLFTTYRKMLDYRMIHEKGFNELIFDKYKRNEFYINDEREYADQYCQRAAYTLIYKLLLIRICEDKGLINIDSEKPYNFLLRHSLDELVKLIFKSSQIGINLTENDEVINPIWKDLKHENKAEEFSIEFDKLSKEIFSKLDKENFNFFNFDASILGDIYEKLLDTDTRKGLGQFYTPEFVIKYILQNTLTSINVVDNPYVKIVDISCGTGHFLIKAYEILRNKFIDGIEALREKYSNEFYEISQNGVVLKVTGEEYWQEENLHYHILKYCIYGADIDSFAVALAKIILLLKDTEGFSDKLNIIQCDSLIKYEEDYNWQCLQKQLEEQKNEKGKMDLLQLSYEDISGFKRIKKIDRTEAERLLDICRFWNNHFDFVIGNPPYIPITKINLVNKQYYKKNYESSKGRTNTFSLFLERIIVGKYTNIGWIVPSRILLNTQYTHIRKMILKNTHIKKITDLKEGVFPQATVDTVIMLLCKKNDNNINLYTEIETIHQKEVKRKKFRQQLFETFSNCYINIYVNKKEIDLINKIEKKSIRLGDIAEIRDGIIQGKVGDVLFLGQEPINSQYCKRVLFGENINTYSLHWDNQYILYNKDLLTELEKERLKGKGLGLRLREPYIFERSKILSRQTADKIIATYDDKGYYYMNTLHGIHVHRADFHPLFVLACMNSKAINFYYTRYNHEVGKAFPQVKIENLNNLPIPKIPEKKQAYFADMAHKTIKLYKELNHIKGHGYKAEVLQKTIDNYLSSIDTELYKALNLSKMEKEIIEKSLKGGLY